MADTASGYKGPPRNPGSDEFFFDPTERPTSEHDDGLVESSEETEPVDPPPPEEGMPLTDAEIEAVSARIVAEVSRKTGATLRA